ncbi:hypothetical protein T484DRAFT_1753673 [Baffinella frigidus]|nr:hypothetical protein T484DRAFT_1753673 [Cryptophyta sp. CCMP2293]
MAWLRGRVWLLKGRCTRCSRAASTPLPLAPHDASSRPSRGGGVMGGGNGSRGRVEPLCRKHLALQQAHAAAGASPPGSSRSDGAALLAVRRQTMAGRATGCWGCGSAGTTHGICAVLPASPARVRRRRGAAVRGDDESSWVAKLCRKCAHPCSVAAILPNVADAMRARAGKGAGDGAAASDGQPSLTTSGEGLECLLIGTRCERCPREGCFARRGPPVS